ncbi:MAG: V-type ATP synthase subunit D [Clostridiales bacterium]
MARLNVNPTRMEQTRLKRRLATARRGHKLLKDKRDELMRQFLEIVRHNLELRKKVEKALQKAHRSFTIASAVMSPEMLEEALMYPKQSVSLELCTKNIMSVNVPVYQFKMKSDDPAEIFPYGFATTSGELDDAVLTLSQTLQDLLELAQSEKTAQMLAQEIEKTRRRVNALEYVMIPQLEETIKYIRMKLEENERGNTSRLMKVKDMMLEEQRQKNLRQDQEVYEAHCLSFEAKK